MPYKAFSIDGIGKVTIFKRRGNRSLRLSVAGDGAVRVSIPYWAPYQTGLDFILSRRTWVAQQIQPAAALLQNDSAIGKTHHLQFLQQAGSSRIQTAVRSDVVRVTYGAKYAWSDTEVQLAAQSASWRALKAESALLLIPRLQKLADIHNFSYRSVNIKRLKTRWGSCDSKGNIVLNLFLVQLPWECIDYVILHELNHTRVMNHGADFWHQMEQVLPDARGYKRRMRAYQPSLQTYSR
jgi:predicted metal-dependent hydrolase